MTTSMLIGIAFTCYAIYLMYSWVDRLAIARGFIPIAISMLMVAACVAAVVLGTMIATFSIIR